MKTKRKHVQRITRAQRLKELRMFIALCFESLGESDLKELSNAAKLCVSTLYRLRSGNFSLATHWNTVDVIGRVAGFRLVEEEHKITMAIVE